MLWIIVILSCFIIGVITALTRNSKKVRNNKLDNDITKLRTEIKQLNGIETEINQLKYNKKHKKYKN